MNSPSRFTCLLLVTALAVTGCGGSEAPEERADRVLSIESHETGVKILLVGVDGATFSVIDPMLEAGELPVIGGLIERGARSNLQSERPMRSPALWTTVSTGRSREQHGIVHFTVEDEATGEPILANSQMRRSLNVWDILGAAGRSVGVVGWWSTWPAEPVRGWLVSDRMTRSRWSEWADGVKQEGLTYPAELADELVPLIVDPMDPPMDEVRRIVELSADEEAEMLAAKRPVRAHGMSVLKFALSNQVTYERIAETLLARERPDFAAVFLIANDAISHTFWHYHQPERYDEIDPADRERLGVAVENSYRRNDEVLGRLLEGADENTVTIVISDHGFKASGKLPEAGSKRRLQDAFEDGFAEDDEDLEHVTVGQSGVHHLDGVFIASGGPILADATVESTLYDLTPTILALMGLPVPEDLPGRVLTEIIDPAFLERFPLRTLPTYERIIDRRALRAAAAGENDESTMEMLKSLGYIN